MLNLVTLFGFSLSSALLDKLLEQTLESCHHLLICHWDPDMVEDWIQSDCIGGSDLSQVLHGDDRPHLVVLAPGLGVLSSGQGVHVPERKRVWDVGAKIHQTLQSQFFPLGEFLIHISPF